MNRGSVFSIILIFYYTLDLTQCTTVTKGKAACDCVWYGDCGLSDKGLPRTCVSKQCRAVPLNNKTVETLLARWCPQYLEGTDGSPPLCCDAANVATLVEKLSIVEDIFGECPTCLKNVFKLLCDLTCSPKQSEFLNVTKTNKDEKYGEYVEEIQVYVAEEYLNGAYNSCKDVFTEFGNLAMDLACGDNGASSCTPKLWYEGDPDTYNFRIMNFGVTLITKDKSWKKFWNQTTKTCDENYCGSSACSCFDCPAACFSFVNHDPQEVTVRYFFYGVLTLIVIVLFIVLAIVVCSFHRYRERKVLYPGIVYSGTISGTIVSGTT